ncbi:phage baseplate assembly protein V [Thiotrichales bacterium 19S3-7]|nr:phage baseplate assembly protein V [Thiotrichales bacterium 19S3-7]MCF6801276.1 phage baseplate assembly protein V [Thiotrichales bacterium 19S3-11]
MTELERLLELERRLANLIRIGKIKSVDERHLRAKVVVGKLESDWLKWLTQRAGDCQSLWSPSQDEQVLILSPCGELNNGIILPALFANNEPHKNTQLHSIYYKDGTQLSYDYKMHKLTVNCIGEVEIVAADKIIVNANAAQIKLKQLAINSPKISVNGNLSITGNINVIEGDVIADGRSLKMHTHIGDSGGITSIAK